jgi:hypothetical protein
VQKIQEWFFAAVSSRQWGRAVILGLLLLSGLIIFALLQDRWEAWANSKIDREGPQLMASIIGSIWFPVVLFGLLAVVWAATIHWLLPRNVTSTVSSRIPSHRDSSLIGWITSLAENDIMQLGERVIMLVKEPTLHYWIPDRLNEKEPRPYINFTFAVVNPTVFLVEIGKEHDGLITMDGTKLTGRLEINTTEVMHGEKKDLIFTQYLLADDINDLAFWHKSDKLPFNFSGLNVWVVTKPIQDTAIQPYRAKVRLNELAYLRVTALVF